MWQDEYWQDLSHEELSQADPKSFADAAEQWPTPSEVFFEAGMVLAVALGFAVAMNVLLRVLGVPIP